MTTYGNLNHVGSTQPGATIIWWLVLHIRGSQETPLITLKIGTRILF